MYILIWKVVEFYWYNNYFVKSKKKEKKRNHKFYDKYHKSPKFYMCMKSLNIFFVGFGHNFYIELSL